MKKNTFFLLFMLLSPSILHAQSGLPRNFERSIPKLGLGKNEPLVKFGIKAGVNLSGIHTNNYTAPWGSLAEKKAPPKFGVTGGVVVDFRISDYFSIQPELLATLKGCIREGFVNSLSSSGNATREWQVNLLYLELPLHFIGKLPIGDDNIYLGVGPYFAYGIFGISTDILNGVTITNKDIFKGNNKLFNPFDIGFSVCTGYELYMGLFFNVGYSRGLINIANADVGKVVNNMINLSIGFKF